MSNVHSAFIPTNQYDLSRHAAERYAVVTAAEEWRSVQRRAARTKRAAEVARPLVIARLFWKRRWT